MAKDKLEHYRSKRDFGRSPEPSGGSRGGARARRRFVIQKHDASTLHYDLRLEAGGVLKSWAVPKGPSTDPRDKRLAIRTEDHPLDYANFEGVIPEGQYGGGAVVVWDRGTYRDLDGGGSTEERIDRGHVKVWLKGTKLRGGYALTRLRKGRGEVRGRAGKAGREQWLLVKMDDDEADARRNPVRTQPESVKSGRTVEQVAARAAPRERDGRT